MNNDVYDQDYFIRGRETGKSLYDNYRWLPDLTLPMTRVLVDHLKIDYRDNVLDFGCARGYTVRALRELGYKGWGIDTSEWAIFNCDDKVHHYVAVDSENFPRPDWIIAKDVFEHIQNINGIINILMETAIKGLFAVVPLADRDGASYVVEDYEKDITHIHRLTLNSWTRMFTRPGWSVEVRYRLKGVKDNYYKPRWEKGNGFITCRRIECL